MAILHFMGFEKCILLQYVLANFCYHSKISEIMSLKEGKACFESWFWRFQAMIQRLVTFGSIEKCCMIMRIYGRGGPSPDGCPQAKEGAERRNQCLSIFFRGVPPVPNFILGGPTFLRVPQLLIAPHSGNYPKIHRTLGDVYDSDYSIQNICCSNSQWSTCSFPSFQPWQPLFKEKKTTNRNKQTNKNLLVLFPSIL